MKVIQNTVAAPVIKKDATTGAQVGDVILFSPHHPKNESSMFSYCAITPNKLYTITEISDTNLSIFKNDDNIDMRLGTAGYRGSYDIITKAVQPKQKEPEFQPVTLILETMEDVKRIAELLGSAGCSCGTSEFKAWGKLKTILGHDYQPCSYIITKN